MCLSKISFSKGLLISHLSIKPLAYIIHALVGFFINIVLYKDSGYSKLSFFMQQTNTEKLNQGTFTTKGTT